jgi:hypothetical protein
MKFTAKHAFIGSGLVLAVVLGIAARSMLPELVRYIRMKRM